MPGVPLWLRPDHQPTAARASVRLYGFSRAPLDPDVPLSLDRHGAPSAEVVHALDLRTHARADEPEWFEGWLAGPLRRMAERELAAPEQLDGAQLCHSIVAEVADPPDLGHLQAAWAATRWLVDQGCSAFLDGHAHNWHDGARLAGLAPGRPFDFGAEVGIVFETEQTPGYGHAMHTRGMAKFARPDLVTSASNVDDVRLLQRVLNQVGLAMAHGRVVTAGRGINFADAGVAFDMVPYLPGENAPEVNLNNDGLLLVRA